MINLWTVPVIVSILVIGLLYSVDTQTADAHDGCTIIGLSDTCVDDDNPCTTVSCESAFTPSPFHLGDHCKNTPITGTCDDANACTSSDVCSAGVCVGDPKNCGDGNECTADNCNPQTGLCANPNSPNEATCGSLGDGVCDLQDRCDGSGSCIDEVAEVTVSCRAASNDCDVEEFCDGAGSCPADVLEPAGTVCGIPADGVKLNCDGTGICVLSSAITCGDGTELVDGVCVANICVAVDDDDDEDGDDD